MGGWGGPVIIGLVLNALLLIGLVVLGVVGVRWAVRQFTPRGTAGDAIEIARRRLAAGEINVEQFEEIRKRLQV
ncbi:MAG: SHOCT domain-containing protein [Chloroflexi bacterium]|nr:SHOCT domain-containing protein [Chloroflexota bacterium]